MPKDSGKDQLVVIRIDGLHSHNCERTIQKALATESGVHEVEVDFNTGQASVLFNRGAVSVKRLMELITEAGYRAVSYTQGSNPDAATH
jgi:copper chaperone CopZ